MDFALSADKWRIALVFLQELVVFFCFHRSAVEPLDHVKYVLTRLRVAGVTFRLHKCDFVTEQM